MEAVTTSPPERPSGSSVYWEYISEQVAREASRKDSIERRSLSLVAAAGTSSALLFGLAAFAVNRANFTLTHTAKIALIAAVVLFFLSALLAIATNWPFEYEEVRPAALQKAFGDELWNQPPSVA